MHHFLLRIISYRSIEMAQRLRMEAVQHMTSKATQMSQNWSPKIQEPCRSLATAKTITKQATKRSLMARETMNKFPTLRRVLKNGFIAKTRNEKETNIPFRINLTNGRPFLCDIVETENCVTDPCRRRCRPVSYQPQTRKWSQPRRYLIIGLRGGGGVGG